MHNSVERGLADCLFRAMDNLQSMVVYWDKNLICRYANKAYQQWFNKDNRATLIGASIRELLGPELFALNEPHIAGALRGEPQEFERKAAGGADGVKYHLAHYVPDIVDGTVVGILIQITDITPIKEVEAELRRQTETLRFVTEAIPATVAVLGKDTRYRFVNSAFERWWGVPLDRVIGHTAREVLGHEEFERRASYARRAWAGETVAFLLEYPESDGVTYVATTYIPLRLQRDEVDGLVVVSQDVTAQKREELRLHELSEHDPLTGLLNRSGFEQYLERAHKSKKGATLAVVYIDLDYFKAVNDQHGHAAGDRILQLFAQRLVNLVRPTDGVARLGGDEFAIALADVGELENANVVADKVLASAKAPFRVGALLLNVGASVGVAFSANQDALDWRALVEHADARLITAKAAGRRR